MVILLQHCTEVCGIQLRERNERINIRNKECLETNGYTRNLVKQVKEFLKKTL